MIHYEGHGITTKPPKTIVRGMEFKNKRTPYPFNYESWTGEKVYENLFPIMYKKKFLTQLIVLIIMLSLMRIISGIV